VGSERLRIGKGTTKDQTAYPQKSHRSNQTRGLRGHQPDKAAKGDDLGGGKNGGGLLRSSTEPVEKKAARAGWTAKEGPAKWKGRRYANEGGGVGGGCALEDRHREPHGERGIAVSTRWPPLEKRRDG